MQDETHGLEPSETDLDALARASRRAAAGGKALQARKAMEKPSLSPWDGRSANKTGRDVQLNVGVRPETKALAINAKTKYGMPVRVFVERAIAMYAQALDEQQARPTTEGTK